MLWRLIGGRTSDHNDVTPSYFHVSPETEQLQCHIMSVDANQQMDAIRQMVSLADKSMTSSKTSKYFTIPRILPTALSDRYLIGQTRSYDRILWETRSQGATSYYNPASVCVCSSLYVLLILDSLHQEHQTFVGSSMTPWRSHNSFIFFQYSPTITLYANNWITRYSYYIQLLAIHIYTNNYVQLFTT